MALLSFQKPAVTALCRHFKTRETAKFGERIVHPPVIVSASVSSGKSIMLAECAKAVQEAADRKEKPATVLIMVIQNQGLLCEQNSDAGWSIGLNNSVYSASCGNRRSTHYQVVYGTVGTIARALELYRFSPYTEEELQLSPDQRSRLRKFHPDLILIDEVHQAPFEKDDSQYMRVLNHFWDQKPHMRLAGMTGSPFRGTNSIVGDTPSHLWKKMVSIETGDPEYPEGGVGNGIISQDFMAEQSWIVPLTFGYPDDGDTHYDYSHLADKDWSYDESELDAATSDRELCLAICADFIEKTKDRGGVLIFAATKRHTRMVAAAMKLLGIEPDQIGIITENTPQKEQAAILTAAKAEKLKFVINVAVLTTGVNVQWWDTAVLLRPIASIVLLIQAIGRILRLLIQDGEMGMVERDALTAEMRGLLIQGSDKPNAMALDYAGVFDMLGELYDSQVLEEAKLAKAKKEGLDLITCPECATMNSPHARRCIGQTGPGGMRCEHYWHFRQCPSCQTKNDQVARECRSCKRMLIDPNAALSGKHYVKGESIPVRAMKIEAGKGGKLSIRYELSDGRCPIEIYWPQSGEQKALNSRIWKGFVKTLPISERDRFRLGSMKASTIMENLELIPVPEEISAREKKGKWTVGRRKFAEQEGEIL